MVMLNPSNSTSLPIPIFAPQFILDEQGQPKKAFTMEPDWLAPRKEVSNGYKRFYSLVARRAMRFGFADLSIERLAKNLGVCERTIKNYVAISRKNNLMDIISTGRSLRFVIIWHEWMPITEDQAKELEIPLLEKNAPLTGNFFQGQTPQVQQNQAINGSQKSLETNFIDHEDKEASQATGTVLGTTEEKDPSLSPTNQPSPEAPATQQSPESQHPANLPDKEPKALKGKFTFEQYKLFAESEKKRKGSIKNSDWFANYLHKTGSQDSQVARFLKVSLDSENIKNSSLKASNAQERLSQSEIKRRELLEIGKKRFDALEDWEQAELQDEKLEGMHWFYGSSTVVQNAVMLGIREKIYLELAQAN